MSVQDYDYYEARAKDVILEDITSSQQNADILERLRNGDPDMKYFSIAETAEDFSNFVVRDGDHLGWLGYFVGRSEQLKGLYIEDYNFPDNLNMDAFFDGLGHNHSIQNLGISTEIGEDFKSLGPFLRNNNSLRDLTFTCFNIGLQCARNIASLLGQQSSLKCLCFEDTDLYDDGLMEVAVALRKQPQIEELSLLGNQNIGRNGCVALGNALGFMRNPNLAIVHLEYNDIDDEGLHALVAGLINCHNLTSLCLSGNELVTAAGLRSLSTLFQSDHCRLERLDLDGFNIDDDGSAVLSAGLGSLPRLKSLYLANNSIGDQGLQSLVGGMVNCNLEQLILSTNLCSLSGHRSLGTLVQRATSLKSLNLCGNAIDDEGLQGLVEGMANCCSLQTLYLSDNHLITAVGLRSIAPFFQSNNCCLKVLWLFGINFGDDGAAALANGLIGNESLINLRFDLSGITARGWATFSRLLCDTSSVNNTYLSNHTLVEIGRFGNAGNPSAIVEYLTLNKLQNCDAAICKILKNHPDIDIEPLFQWNLKCLPLVVIWLESARSYMGNVNESTEVFHCRKLSALYKFVRGMPQLAVDGCRGKKMKDIQSKSKSKSKKRKLDQSL
eukprot:scaffold3549_cov110-Skeletonema_dohrnii-CCMP3373.AAC.14